MDLNTLPGNTWTSLEDGPYELAEYAVQKNTKLLILLNNWLQSSQPPSTHDDGKHDWNTLEYWAMRLRPLWAKDGKAKAKTVDNSRAEGSDKEGEGEETIVVVCNRSGVENGAWLSRLFLAMWYSFLRYRDHICWDLVHL